MRGRGAPHAGCGSPRPAHKLYVGGPGSATQTMTDVTFVSSIQGYQDARVAEVVERLKADRPEWNVEILPAEKSAPVLQKYKLKFGPAILVDGRVEFVGIPRYRMLVERIAMIASQRPNPRSAAPPAPPPAPKPAPQTPSASPAQPGS